MDTRFSDLLVWIAAVLTEGSSTNALAEHTGMSERHFRRLFKKIHGETPVSAVERIRIEMAKDWFINHRVSVNRVSRGVGFRSTDAFSRAFHRLVAIRPLDFQQRFGQPR